MSDLVRTTVYDGQLIRVEHQPVEGRELPYEFTSKIGEVSILPIIHDRSNAPLVLRINNHRRHYGPSVGLPGGYIDGAFDNPEHPAAAAERELREETGYGYKQPRDRRMDTFALRKVCNRDTITFPRFFTIMRDVEYIGGEVCSPHEIITPQPLPLDTYIGSLFQLNRGDMYTEVNAAFAKAEREVGRDAVMGWLARGDAPSATAVTGAFEPWLLPVAA